MRITNGAALPSSTGTSGPSTSTIASSTPSAYRAESRCSTVSTHTPSRVQPGGVVEAAEVLEGGRDLDADVRPPEADAVFGGRGPEVEPHRLARVQPDAGAADGPLERPAIAHENAAGRACNRGTTRRADA